MTRHVYIQCHLCDENDTVWGDDYDEICARLNMLGWTYSDEGFAICPTCSRERMD